MIEIQIIFTDETSDTSYNTKYSIRETGIQMTSRDDTIRFIPWHSIKECDIKEV